MGIRHGQGTGMQGCCGLSRAEKDREGASHVGIARTIVVMLLVACAAVSGWTAGISEGSARIVLIIALVFLGGTGLILPILDFWKSPPSTF